MTRREQALAPVLVVIRECVSIGTGVYFSSNEIAGLDHLIGDRFQPGLVACESVVFIQHPEHKAVIEIVMAVLVIAVSVRQTMKYALLAHKATLQGFRGLTLSGASRKPAAKP